MSRCCVIFDLDDTLYPERAFALSAFDAIGEWAEANLGVAGLSDDMVRLLDAGHLGQIFPLSLQRRGVDAAHAGHLLELYRQHQPASLQLYPDTTACLDACAARGAIGLITDGTVAVQQAKVRALGIGRRFQHIVYTHGLGGRGFAKPHPAAFEAMQSTVGRAGDRFVYVGDNPAKDFLAPNRMGWTTVQVVRPSRIHASAKTIDGGAPQHTLATLAALPALLDR